MVLRSVLRVRGLPDFLLVRFAITSLARSAIDFNPGIAAEHEGIAAIDINR